MNTHRYFRRRPFQTVHRCVACGAKCPTLRDRRDHDRVHYAAALAEEESA